VSRSPKAVSDYMARIGSKGGQATGKSKRRPAAHYERLAAMKRKRKEPLSEPLTYSGELI